MGEGEEMRFGIRARPLVRGRAPAAKHSPGLPCVVLAMKLVYENAWLADS